MNSPGLFPSSAPLLFSFWLPQGPACLSCPQILFLEQVTFFSPYVLPSFWEGMGPLGSPGDQAMASVSGFWTSLGLQGETPNPADVPEPAALPSFPTQCVTNVLLEEHGSSQKIII